MKTVDEIFKKPFIDYFGSLEIKPNIKPSHGSCCTCQVCGYHHDDCNCSAREIVKGIAQAKSELRALLMELRIGAQTNPDKMYYGEAIDDVLNLLEGK